MSKGTAFSYELPTCTLEGVRLIKSHLKTSGVLIANVIAAPQGPNSQFFKDCYLTFKKTFKNVYVFADRSSEPTKTQDVVFLLTLKKIDLKNLFRQGRRGGSLTQDENFYLQLMKKLYSKPINLSRAKVLRNRDKPLYATS